MGIPFIKNNQYSIQYFDYNPTTRQFNFRYKTKVKTIPNRSKLANVGKYAHKLMDRVKQIGNSIRVLGGAGTKESPFELSGTTVYGKRLPGVTIIGK